MNRRKYIKTIALGAFIPSFSAAAFPLDILTSGSKLKGVNFNSNWENWSDMKWVGPEYWGNRMQDWKLKNGMAVCRLAGANRNLQLLTIQKPKKTTDFSIGVTITMLDRLPSSESGCIGLRIGSKGLFDDYRSAAVFGKGLDIGYALSGNFKVGKERIATGFTKIPTASRLLVDFKQRGDGYDLKVSITDNEKNNELFVSESIPIDADVVAGNFGLLADVNTKSSLKSDEFVGFSDWKITGDDLYVNEEQLFGPVCFAQYTLHQNKLKITAQLAPIEQIKGHKVVLQFKENGVWGTRATKTIEHIGRAVNFAIEDWNATKDTPYRVSVELPLKNEIHQYTYDGTIAKEPVDKEEVSAAVFSCNMHYGFPDTDVYDNVSKLNPDIILFLGDQFYEGTGGFGAQRTGDIDDLCLGYLRKWMMFGWSYRELFRHKPCAIIPDDHDVYHGNVWGEGGKKADISQGHGMLAQDSGGYKMPAEWVNMVQYTQTSHLPDPYDPTPVKQGIGVYYTHWNYGGLSFAILEDRKFKSAPKHILPPEADVVNGWIHNKDFDIKKHRDLDAVLLGDRQHKFIDDWSQDWGNNVEMKVVLSQTNFATVATLPKTALNDNVVPSLPIPEKGEYVLGDTPTVDMDSNGWPANQRDKAVEAIRKCFAFHIAGDQHLGSFIQYGVTEHGDSGYAFAGPALNNIWPRRFWPEVNSKNHSYDKPAYTGDHIDGFGNKLTVYAVGNPFHTGLEPAIVHNRATGYGIVTFNKKERTIETACWARYADPTKGASSQLPGWPVTIKQEDNYGRKAVAWLPTIEDVDGVKPLLSVFDENETLVYCIKMTSNVFKPKVFAMGKYIIVLENSTTKEKKIFIKVKAKTANKKTIKVTF
ncbi:alkaline phosphatase D family protein [Cellulophaga sp. F20128]|uniref:alkaline phosphatase D family protein n=1 Tax=Cellulophaga sp. F20128 TaxID=2926413 RepID=UPI001FF5656B|nr:alkaline phosphatase D family protein [Cellulophaga sp. F20128]MCK0157157.1 alkaline phosphatase D family protein [Cellulophaga sp. F20128]